VSKIDTKNRILDAAEVLFAERGFADTSLRLITSEADVNLASVNYHFGSKKEGYIDSQGHLRRFITAHYGPILQRITQAISKANPALSPADLFWRLHFTLGTVVFTMASADALRDIAQADFGQQLDVEGLVRNVIPYLASGVGAPVESTRLSLAV